jgi:hypothetical protein
VSVITFPNGASIIHEQFIFAGYFLPPIAYPGDNISPLVSFLTISVPFLHIFSMELPLSISGNVKTNDWYYFKMIPLFRVSGSIF